MRHPHNSAGSAALGHWDAECQRAVAEGRADATQQHHIHEMNELDRSWELAHLESPYEMDREDFHDDMSYRVHRRRARRARQNLEVDLLRGRMAQIQHKMENTHHNQTLVCQDCCCVFTANQYTRCPNDCHKTWRGRRSRAAAHRLTESALLILRTRARLRGDDQPGRFGTVTDPDDPTGSNNPHIVDAAIEEFSGQPPPRDFWHNQWPYTIDIERLQVVKVYDPEAVVGDIRGLLGRRRRW